MAIQKSHYPTIAVSSNQDRRSLHRGEDGPWRISLLLPAKLTPLSVVALPPPPLPPPALHPRPSSASASSSTSPDWNFRRRRLSDLDCILIHPRERIEAEPPSSSFSPTPRWGRTFCFVTVILRQRGDVRKIEQDESEKREKES